MATPCAHTKAPVAMFMLQLAGIRPTVTCNCASRLANTQANDSISAPSSDETESSHATESTPRTSISTEATSTTSPKTPEIETSSVDASDSQDPEYAVEAVPTAFCKPCQEWHDEDIFCPTCNECFTSKNERRKHQKTERHCFCHRHVYLADSMVDFAKHQQRCVCPPLSCVNCQEVLDSHTGRERHLKYHNGARGFECMDCSRTFKTCGAFEAHIQCQLHLDTVGNNVARVKVLDKSCIPQSRPPSRPPPAPRPVNNTQSPQVRSSPTPHPTVHPKCPASGCQQRFELRQDSIRHQKEWNHSYCLEHDAVFDSEAERDEHLRSCAHTTDFECIVCNKELQTQGDFYAHITSHCTNGRMALHAWRDRHPKYITASNQGTDSDTTLVGTPQGSECDEEDEEDGGVVLSVEPSTARQHTSEQSQPPFRNSPGANSQQQPQNNAPKVAFAHSGRPTEAFATRIEIRPGQHITLSPTRFACVECNIVFLNKGQLADHRSTSAHAVGVMLKHLRQTNVPNSRATFNEPTCPFCNAKLEGGHLMGDCLQQRLKRNPEKVWFQKGESRQSTMSVNRNNEKDKDQYETASSGNFRRGEGEVSESCSATSPLGMNHADRALAPPKPTTLSETFSSTSTERAPEASEDPTTAIMQCFCGVTFGSLELLLKHVEARGHRHGCSPPCGRLFGSQQALADHCNDTGHTGHMTSASAAGNPTASAAASTAFAVPKPGARPASPSVKPSSSAVHHCAVCNQKFRDADGLQQHMDHKHFACPTCRQCFAGSEQRVDHQKAAAHCYCQEHGNAFQDEKHFNKHVVRTVHVTKVSADSPTPAPVASSSCAATPLGTHVSATATTHCCPICSRKLVDAQGVFYHMNHKHPGCPTCDQRYSTPEQRDGHQKATGHCYCREHNKIYKTEKLFAQHQRENDHHGYKCVDCDKAFDSELALDDHLESPGHSGVVQAALSRAEQAQNAAAEEERQLRCEECKQNFINTTAFRQHKESVKHKPLSELRCPMSDACKNIFTSPSALLFHLESGKCKSGMNRQKLNVLVHSHDPGRQITYAKNAASVISTATATGSLPSAGESDLASRLSALSLSGRSGKILTPSATSEGASDAGSESTLRAIVEDADDEESTDTPIFTPTTRSRSSSIGGVALTPSISEWSFINNAGELTPPPTPSLVTDATLETIRYDEAKKFWPCPMKDCKKKFQKKNYLLQHINSAAHAPALFHCPTGLEAFTKGKSKEFKTLSGFAQHVEAGACAGGKEALKHIVGIFESEITRATGKQVRLLKASEGAQ